MARESALARLPLAVKAGIVIGWLGLVGVVYFVVFYGDLASSIKAAQGKERQLHGQLAEARKAEFAYQKDLAEVADREQRQSELNKVLPEEPQVASFLRSVQEVANVSGINLVAWTPQEERGEEFYARVPMKLEMQGKYHQIARFFYLVGQLERIINMENIAITEPKFDNDEVTVRVAALATAFRILKESKAREQEGDRRAKAAGRGKKPARAKQTERK
jgi:type IV pilus assembly protein PilO